MSERKSMQYDVVIVGAGPAGLSAAIRLKQLAADGGARTVASCILEKGSEVGAHILSGAVLDPKALNELIPDWKDKGAPLTVPVTENHHWVLTRTGKWAMPGADAAAVHAQQGHLHAEPGQFLPLAGGAGGGAWGRDLPRLPGGGNPLSTTMARSKAWRPATWASPATARHRPDYQPGMELHARYTFFAEGARGHLTKRLTEIFDLRKDSGPQVFGLGVKELWDVPAGQA